METLLDTTISNYTDSDSTAASRKQDHIELAFEAQVFKNQLDNRFYYEPALAAHPKKEAESFEFLGKKMNAPLWVSSMTGGTEWAKIINQNLAKVCGEYKLGMGLGSCRALLTDDECLPDFDVRKFMGDQPLYANLGIAQLEKLIETKQTKKIDELLKKLQADGLIIHINPLQEWLQPEGDRFEKAPLETIRELLQTATYPIIVKEVGQGFGKQSLEELLKLPLAAVDFAASGGTNFALLELKRSSELSQHLFESLAHIGHSAEEMVNFCNEIKQTNKEINCNQIIISGGVKTFLDGYYLTEKINFDAIYGQASGFLKHARGSYEELQAYTEGQLNGLKVAKQFLKVK
ncbi:isopentenyl-diphosphate delta-isomerase [Bernardetia sp.]|uniref:isopentenyl-diphosphate delta-isomerase n=1 Tax=Bernardetia sp. TaxID=1937974 RepID=UPI0025BD7904|nr:isopentenyl-diphosphate delta-isomerase [Bernardetia sp.]